MAEPGDDDFDPQEIAAAEALDRQIDAVLAGRAGPEVAPEISWLSAAVRTDPPPGLAARIERAHERRVRLRLRPVRYAAAAMAYLFLSHGLGNLFVGDWVARGVGEHHSPHALGEGGFALIAVGIAVLAGVLRPRMLPVSVAAGVPLALVLGVYGIGEVGVFAAGAALHLTQGVLGVVLGVTFWRARRDTRGPRDE